MAVEAAILAFFWFNREFSSIKLWLFDLLGGCYCWRKLPGPLLVPLANELASCYYPAVLAVLTIMLSMGWLRESGRRKLPPEFVVEVVVFDGFR